MLPATSPIPFHSNNPANSNNSPHPANSTNSTMKYFSRLLLSLLIVLLPTNYPFQQLEAQIDPQESPKEGRAEESSEKGEQMPGEGELQKEEQMPDGGQQNQDGEQQNQLEESKNRIYRVNIKGAITPSAMETLTSAIETAEEKQAKALLVVMDTPGGLVSSMDEMIRQILSSQVPVITFVYPPGAACGSAGVYIMYASHIAAMAPATNIGSATPVTMGSGGDKKKDDRIPETAGSDDSLNMKRKLINHARAQIRSLAEYHGRNARFGERSITHAANVTSYEALKIQAIDVVAENEEELLKKIDKRLVRMQSGKEPLELSNAEVVNIETDFRRNLLDFLTNPNLAYILMMIGVLGILAEIQYPGSIFPGAVGAVCLILGLYAMQTLPIDYAGLGLIALGFLFFILEIWIVSYGLLAIAGVVSVVLGSLMLVRSGDEFMGLSIWVVTTISLTVSLAMAALTYLAVRSQRAKRVSGYEGLFSEIGISQSDIDSQNGVVRIHGEFWEARSRNSSIPAKREVEVVDKRGLILFVKEVHPESK